MVSTFSSFNVTGHDFLILICPFFLLREFCSCFFLSFSNDKQFQLTCKEYFLVKQVQLLLYVGMFFDRICLVHMFVCFILDDCLVLVMVEFCDLRYKFGLQRSNFVHLECFILDFFYMQQFIFRVMQRIACALLRRDEKNEETTCWNSHLRKNLT